MEMVSNSCVLVEMTSSYWRFGVIVHMVYPLKFERIDLLFIIKILEIES